MYQYWCYRYKTNTHNHLPTEFHHYSYLNSHAGGIWAKLLNIPYWQTLLIGATTLQHFLNQLLLCAVRHQNMIGWAHGFLSKHWIWFQHAVSHSGEHRRASPWDETLVTLRITLHNSKWEEVHTWFEQKAGCRKRTSPSYQEYTNPIFWTPLTCQTFSLLPIIDSIKSSTPQLKWWLTWNEQQKWVMKQIHNNKYIITTHWTNLLYCRHIAGPPSHTLP
jgi:hypothetical protein